MLGAPPFSSFELIQKVDTWPYYHTHPKQYKEVMSKFFYFMVKNYRMPLGYVHCSFVEAMTWPSYWHIDHEKRFLTLATTSNFEERTRSMEETFTLAYERKVPGMCKRANEPYAVWAEDGEHLMDMEVLAVDSFGIVGKGVHLIAYAMTKNGLKYWIQRRSRMKSTYPGMLDSTAAGNLLSNEKPLNGMVREAAEEAGIDEGYARANIKACGTVSYQMSKCYDGRAGSLPHVQFNYELELQQEMVPRAADGEVDEFLLLTLDELCHALTSGEFKPNVVMTYVAHLVRHGHVNTENEQNLDKVCSRLHRKIDLFIVEDLC